VLSGNGFATKLSSSSSRVKKVGHIETKRKEYKGKTWNERECVRGYIVLEEG
jgi:hypothetical protein